MSERKFKHKRVHSPIRKIGFNPISKTLLVVNALILILALSTIKYVFTFIFTKKIQTNYSKHLKDAIRVWQRT